MTGSRSSVGSFLLSAVAALVLIGGVAGILRSLRDDESAASRDDPGVPTCEAGSDCGEGVGVADARADGAQRLSPDVCASAGYLCAQLEARGVVVVRRWSDNTVGLTVHVPPSPAPGFEGREHQAAAVRGVTAWNGRPFPIRIDRSGRFEADLTVDWRPGLTGGNMPFASGRWTRATGLRSSFLEVPFRHPSPGGYMTPREVEVSAVKQMGHALGLEWSDSQGDVMHPDNASTRPSVRDLQTIEALYSFPNGAFIRR